MCSYIFLHLCGSMQRGASQSFYVSITLIYDEYIYTHTYIYIHIYILQLCIYIYIRNLSTVSLAVCFYDQKLRILHVIVHRRGSMLRFSTPMVETCYDAFHGSPVPWNADATSCTQSHCFFYGIVGHILWGYRHYIALKHRPYGRYLQFRFLRWPVIITVRFHKLHVILHFHATSWKTNTNQQGRGGEIYCPALNTFQPIYKTTYDHMLNC